MQAVLLVCIHNALKEIGTVMQVLYAVKNLMYQKNQIHQKMSQKCLMMTLILMRNLMKKIGNETKKRALLSFGKLK